MMAGLMLLSGAAATVCAPARAEMALLLEEPYGQFGHMNPTGHSAIYLNHVCATSPTELRACHPGEPGVVISRYHRVEGYDWVAIPLVPYLYAVEHVSEIPATATPELEAKLRDAYRRRYLKDMVADGPDGAMPDGDWTQLVGASYDREIFGLNLRTSTQQDAAFMALYNDRSNEAKFHLIYRNCADFTRTVINIYFPKAVHRSLFTDAGIMTPTQAARSVVKYGKKHPELQLSPFVVPQVAGTIQRSRKAHGVSEAILKSKKYVIPLSIVAPEITGVLAVGYATSNRDALPADAPVLSGAKLVKAETTGKNADKAPVPAVAVPTH
jgi:hypothetical protein